MKQPERKTSLPPHALWSQGPQAGKLIEEMNGIEVREEDHLRWLHRGNDAVESVINLNHPCELILPHSQAISLFQLFNTDAKSALNLGLGGGDLLRHLNKTIPELSITSIENDADMVRLHEKYFADYDTENQRCPQAQDNIIHIDAEHYMQRYSDKDTATYKQYDVILIDLYDDLGICPFVLSSIFLKQCISLLPENGILCLNLMLSSQEQLQSIVSNLHSLSGAIPLMFHIPYHPNIITFCSPAFPTMMKSDELITRATTLDSKNNTNYAVDFTRQLI